METEKEKSSLDLLGVQPICKAVETTVEKSFQGIEGFLKSVCAPALEELGLMFRDKIRNWRLNNILKILEKSKGKFNFQNEELQIQAHPRVALGIIDNGSVVDDEELQDMWAGLFVSSCTKSGQNDENLIFVDLLKQLTVPEARILKYSCERVRKILFKNGLIISGDGLTIDFKSLTKISEINEYYRLDRELDHLRTIGLIGNSGFSRGGGFYAEDQELNAYIAPTPLALNMYVKCQGHNIDPRFYWKDNMITEEEWQKEIKKQTSI
ncbi:MAG: DUF4393 domain-containing protein [Leptospirales bacterium]|nr:DUF4393 domain-containing protein [Leptospirales bacterium]